MCGAKGATILNNIGEVCARGSFFIGRNNAGIILAGLD
jgi:hypothetical protein